MSLESFRVVLVRPKYPRNIGMAARAMSHYGLKRLILIEPRCTLDEEAREGAAHAQKELADAAIYPNWQRFYDCEPEGVRIAFSARAGEHRRIFEFAPSLQTDLELRSEIQKKATYLIFGPEDHGLAEADLDFVHRVFRIQFPGAIQSMNLSHAVMTILTIAHASLGTQLPEPEEKESFFFPDQTLRRWLEALNMDLTQHPRVNAYTVLKRLVLKSFPTRKELHVFETVLQQTIRKLKERSPET